MILRIRTEMNFRYFDIRYLLFFSKILSFIYLDFCFFNGINAHYRTNSILYDLIPI